MGLHGSVLNLDCMPFARRSTWAIAIQGVEDLLFFASNEIPIQAHIRVWRTIRTHCIDLWSVYRQSIDAIYSSRLWDRNKLLWRVEIIRKILIFLELGAGWTQDKAVDGSSFSNQLASLKS